MKERPYSANAALRMESPKSPKNRILNYAEIQIKSLEMNEKNSTHVSPSHQDPYKVPISDLTNALIREFLVSKGYRKTLEAFAIEDKLVFIDCDYFIHFLQD